MGGADRAREGMVGRSAGSDSAKSTAELLKRTPGKCPQGHGLSSWIARAGHCDGCGRMVLKGERVMDCRSCNWYLCDTCLPQGRDNGSALWDVLSYVVDSATQEMSELASEIASFVPVAACTAPSKASLFAEELEIGQAGKGEDAGRDQGGLASGKEAVHPEHTELATPPASTVEAASEAPAEKKAAPPQKDLMEFTDDLMYFDHPTPTQTAAAAPVPPASSSEDLFSLQVPKLVPAPAPTPVVPVGLADDLFGPPVPGLATAPAPASTGPAGSAGDLFSLEAAKAAPTAAPGSAPPADLADDLFGPFGSAEPAPVGLAGTSALLDLAPAPALAPALEPPVAAGVTATPLLAKPPAPKAPVMSAPLLGEASSSSQPQAQAAALAA